jgi:tetratricopeptide (TPR) repeat protein
VIALNLELLSFEDHPEPMNWIARSYAERGDYANSRTWFERCLAASRNLDNWRRDALHGLATIATAQGDYAQAKRLFSIALGLARPAKDAALMSAIYLNLSVVAEHEGDLDRAEHLARRAWRIRKRVGNKAEQAWTLHQLASLGILRGNYSGAREALRESLQLKSVTGGPAMQITTWHNLAAIDIAEGGIEAAAEKTLYALEISRRFGKLRHEADALNQLGYLSTILKEFEVARHVFEEGLAITIDRGSVLRGSLPERTSGTGCTGGRHRARSKRCRTRNDTGAIAG